MSDVEHFEVNLTQDAQNKGAWRVEVFDEDGSIFIAVFSGARAKEIASEWAAWKYGSFDEVGPADRSRATIVTTEGTFKPKPLLRLIVSTEPKSSNHILNEGGEG